MRGLEIARKFYEEHGAPMLERDFPRLLPLIACGLVGSGSECYGFDDDLSRDHDFEAGFCIFLPGEDVVDRRAAFELERAYSRLPKEFMGVKRAAISPVGGNRHGVIRISDFYAAKIGVPDGALTQSDWMRIPEYALAEATNGEVFADGYGLFTCIRNALLGRPEDVRRKKLAGQLIVMAQSGQYNYARCLARGETGAAQLAAIEFAKAAMRAAFLLARRYMPYEKWAFRALRALPEFSGLADPLERLISTGNTQSEAAAKREIIENVCSAVCGALRAQSLTERQGNELAPISYSVNDSVADPNLRNMNIFAGA